MNPEISNPLKNIINDVSKNNKISTSANKDNVSKESENILKSQSLGSNNLINFKSENGILFNYNTTQNEEHKALNTDNSFSSVNTENETYSNNTYKPKKKIISLTKDGSVIDTPPNRKADDEDSSRKLSNKTITEVKIDFSAIRNITNKNEKISTTVKENQDAINCALDVNKNLIRNTAIVKKSPLKLSSLLGSYDPKNVAINHQKELVSNKSSSSSLNSGRKTQFSIPRKENIQCEVTKNETTESSPKIENKSFDSFKNFSPKKTSLDVKTPLDISKNTTPQASPKNENKPVEYLKNITPHRSFNNEETPQEIKKNNHPQSSPKNENKPMENFIKPNPIMTTLNEDIPREVKNNLPQESPINEIKYLGNFKSSNPLKSPINEAYTSKTKNNKITETTQDIENKPLNTLKNGSPQNTTMNEIKSSETNKNECPTDTEKIENKPLGLIRNASPHSTHVNETDAKEIIKNKNPQSSPKVQNKPSETFKNTVPQVSLYDGSPIDIINNNNVEANQESENKGIETYKKVILHNNSLNENTSLKNSTPQSSPKNENKSFETFKNSIPRKTPKKERNPLEIRKNITPQASPKNENKPFDTLKNNNPKISFYDETTSEIKKNNNIQSSPKNEIKPLLLYTKPNPNMTTLNEGILREVKNNFPQESLADGIKPLNTLKNGTSQNTTMNEIKYSETNKNECPTDTEKIENKPLGLIRNASPHSTHVNETDAKEIIKNKNPQSSPKVQNKPSETSKNTVPQVSLYDGSPIDIINNNNVEANQESENKGIETYKKVILHNKSLNESTLVKSSTPQSSPKNENKSIEKFNNSTPKASSTNGNTNKTAEIFKNPSPRMTSKNVDTPVEIIKNNTPKNSPKIQNKPFNTFKNETPHTTPINERSSEGINKIDRTICEKVNNNTQASQKIENKLLEISKNNDTQPTVHNLNIINNINLKNGSPQATIKNDILPKKEATKNVPRVSNHKNYKLESETKNYNATDSEANSKLPYIKKQVRAKRNNDESCTSETSERDTDNYSNKTHVLGNNIKNTINNDDNDTRIKAFNLPYSSLIADNEKSAPQTKISSIILEDFASFNPNPNGLLSKEIEENESSLPTKVKANKKPVIHNQTPSEEVTKIFDINSPKSQVPQTPKFELTLNVKNSPSNHSDLTTTIIDDKPRNSSYIKPTKKKDNDLLINQMKKEFDRSGPIVRSSRALKRNLPDLIAIEEAKNYDKLKEQEEDHCGCSGPGGCTII